MRDTGGYKALGFDTLEAYTLATMGMKQRQAYNYIAIAEKLPAQLIEQNAAAGVTKLALLAQLSGQEQRQDRGGNQPDGNDSGRAESADQRAAGQKCRVRRTAQPAAESAAGG